MTWQASLYDEFVNVTNDARHHQRGYRLEELTQQLFQIAHFRALRSPGIARPRQTDLMATNGRETYLIETKWESKPIDIDAIDSLRSRLSRTHGNVIGIIISVSGFTLSAM